MLPGLADTSAGRQTCLHDYRVLRTLGEGSFSKVKLALHIPTGTEVAVKIISKKEQSAFTAKNLLCEVHSLKTLRHPHIVGLLEVISTEDTLFLVTEFVSGGDMHDHLMKHGPLTEEEARDRFRQLVSALQYCHRRGVVHRDLKPENVLLDPAGSAKLADFGLCSLESGRLLSTYCGTVYYAAPEVQRLEPYDGPPADVWSLGVLLHVTLTGSLPFQGEDFGAVQRSVLSGAYSPPLLLSPECAQLLRGMLTLDPGKRKTLQEVMGDPWVNWGRPKLRPHRPLPCDTRDSWVTETMITMGFQWSDIQESLRKRRYNHAMAVFLILKAQKPQGDGHASTGRSLPCAEASSCSSLPPWVAQLRASARPRRRGGSEPVLPTWLREAGCQRPEKQEPGLKAAEPAGALPRLQSGTATPSTTPLQVPSLVPSTPSASTSGGAREGSCRGDSQQAGQPSGGAPASPSGRSQGRGGATRRLLKVLRGLCCCLPSKIWHRKLNRVRPR
ncbi:serine/threonine-protein kinase MARK2-like [Equus quagga]|uniref:serine/threonine-protein kinase MARK2-like n=1 Tax=Equus quagga TaxID=89248 RepID=UPI001EE35C88|nr:serine/threonine-protein kinase MARK2-like [Equus quagga]